MKLAMYLSEMIMPLVIFYIVSYGLMKKINIYDEFVDGVKDGVKTVVGIMPTLIGLMMAVGMLRTSGFFTFLTNLMEIVTDKFLFPAAAIPVIIVRLFSSSAATGLALDVFKEYGTDSYVGTLVSIVMSCTEAVFYVMSVYFIAAGVKKTRWTLPGSLITTAAGVIASYFLTNLIVGK